MGRPSKHRLQTTASLRQRDIKLVKLAEDSDENGWHGQLGGPLGQSANPSTYQASRLRNMSPDELAGKLSVTDNALMMPEDRLLMRDGQREQMKMSAMMTAMLTQRSRSLGSECVTVSDVVNSDSNSSLSPKLSSSRNCYVGAVSVKMESDVDLSSTSLSSSVSTADKHYTVSWPGSRAARDTSSKQQHVLSGGYCRERSADAVSSQMMFVADHFCSSPTYVVKNSMSQPVTAVTDSTCDSRTVSHDSTLHADVTRSSVCTRTVQSPDDGISASQSGDVSRLADGSQMLDVSPGCKWHIASDRDSPYVSVMALASTCHLFSESCPTNSLTDDDSVEYDQSSSQYWLKPELPDENVIFTEKHCELINQITAAYDRYVQTGSIINETLVTEMKVFTSLLLFF